MKIVTAAEMREIDRLTSERFGVPSLTLMENAGTAVAEVVRSKYPEARSIGIICGKGNNGGDGFVAARKLRDASSRYEVRVLLLADPDELKGDAAEMYRRMEIPPVLAASSEALASASAREILTSDVLVDAVLGTGFRPPVTGLYGEAISAMNASAKPIVAVDIPSGADADAFAPQHGALRARADHIVTFTAARPAHVFDELTRGQTVIAPIGSPPEAIKSELKLNLITPADFAPLLRDRVSDGHKGLYGHALVIGGSFGKAGAAAMAGMSALRVGAGLVTVATPKSVLPTVAGFAAEIMTEPLAETEAGTIALAALDYNRLDNIASGKDVIALGPGISRNSDTVQFVRAVVGRYPAPLVIDADGVNAFEGAAERLDGSSRLLVLTPHPGEMARLTGLSTKDVQARRLEVSRSFAQQHHCIVVLKGNRTLVALPSGEVWVNTTGNPGMATGGTGDILTGMVAGALGQAIAGKQGLTAEQAVIAAVYLHGAAGDVARERMGEHSLIATDLLAGLPEAFRRARAALGSAVVKF